MCVNVIWDEHGTYIYRCTYVNLVYIYVCISSYVSICIYTYPYVSMIL